MSAIELKEMMIHVERIVRPVRAAARRKLTMRRELLGHLQAALEEERAGGLEEGAAWEAAKKRLGVPAELTRELQRSVPRVEGVLMWRWPGKSSVSRRRRGQNLNLGFLGLRFWQGMLFMMVAQVFMYGGITVLAIRMLGGNLAAFRALAERTWQAPVGALVTAALVGVVVWTGLSIAEAGADRRAARAVGLGACGTGAIMAWQGAIYLLFGASGQAWLEVAGGALAGVIMGMGLAWLGRFLRPGMREFGEWLTLEIGED